MNQVFKNNVTGMAHVADTRVLLNESTVVIGDYPISHILKLIAEYDGSVTDVVTRLECDGWSPLDIVTGAEK